MAENIILAIESSGSTCGIALGIDGKLAGEYSILEKNLHDKLLAEFIRRILEDNKLEVADLSAVAVSAGPGSFTGLRIGASIAKGLCYGNNPKMIAVPTLSALANAALASAKILKASQIVAVVPAYKDLYYYQKFDENLAELSDITQVEIQELKQFDSPSTFICGNYPYDCENAMIMQDYRILAPQFVLNLAIKYFQSDKFVSAEDFVPLYIQEFQVKTKNMININNSGV